MPKSKQVADSLPPMVANNLRRMGENLAIARRRRNESQHTWAARIGVSIPTLIRLEKGDPTVSAGTYATALWLMGKAAALADATAPALDLGALEGEVRKALTPRVANASARAKSRAP